MCGWGAAIAAGVGILLQMQSNKQETQQQVHYQNYQAQLSNRDAQVQDQRAVDAKLRGSIEARRFRDKVRGFEKKQVASFANNNIDITSGTVTDLITDTRVQGELDAAIIENNALREAYGFELQGQSSRDSAEFSKYGARAAKSRGRINNLNTLFSGGVQAYSLLS